MATIKQIAMLAGVSRGTVDRVLNKRGSVNPATEKRIIDIAQAINYVPDLAGKTLALKKKQLKFGYIHFGSTSSNPFFCDIIRGIESRAAELADYGVTVTIKDSPIDKPDEQVHLIDELFDSGISGLVITPINHQVVAERLKKVTVAGIPVVTVNSDLPNSGRLAYVGSDYYNSGETAAGMMNIICGGEAKVGVIIGSPWVLCHSERLAGFRKRIETSYPGIQVVGLEVNHDDDLESFDVTRRLLEKNPQIDALFLAAAGVEGACRALEKLDLHGKIKIISFDTTPIICEMVRKGVINATIDQEPFKQGAKPLSILMDYLGMDVVPDKEFYYTKAEIKITENL